MTLWYQFIDRGWFWILLRSLVTTIFFLLYFIIFVPESPKWSYTQEDADEARGTIIYVAHYNGIPKRQQDKLKEMKWDFEIRDIMIA